MMHRKIFHFVLVMLVAVFFLTGCKKWEDHNAITDPMLGKDIFQQISGNANLSSFKELLTRSGYDKILASSRTFTVFAPTNNALTTIDPSLINDSARLRMFVANFITYQPYYTGQGNVKRLKMLNGKYQNFGNGMLNDANISVADKYAKNGVIHVIDKMLPVLPNTWEMLSASMKIPAKQKTYLLSLFQNVFDSSNAVEVGVDPLTGEPVYQPGTDSVRTNLFWHEVYDLRDESKQYTLFLLVDSAWDAASAKYRPYFTTGNADSTINLSNWAVVKDFAVDTLYLPASIPDTIITRFNTKVGIDKSAIIDTIKTSNGIIYIMSKINVQAKDKFQQYFIEAENYRYSNVDRRNNTYFRDKFNPLTGKTFRDVLVYGHGVARFNLNYRITEVPALKYKAYWVAVHDRINNYTGTFQQKLSIGSPTAPNLPYVTVKLEDYSEVYLGEFTLTSYNAFLDLYLTAANSTSTNANILVCDYIRLVPVL